MNTELTSKPVKTGFSKSPFNVLFPCLTSWKTGEGEEEEEGEEEDGEESEEEVQLEIISDSITQGVPEVWQMKVNPIPPVASGPPTSQSTSTPVRLPGQQIYTSRDKKNCWESMSIACNFSTGHKNILEFRVTFTYIQAETKNCFVCVGMKWKACPLHAQAIKKIVEFRETFTQQFESFQLSGPSMQAEKTVVLV